MWLKEGGFLVRRAEKLRLSEARKVRNDTRIFMNNKVLKRLYGYIRAWLVSSRRFSRRIAIFRYPTSSGNLMPHIGRTFENVQQKCGNGLFRQMVV